MALPTGSFPFLRSRSPSPEPKRTTTIQSPPKEFPSPNILRPYTTTAATSTIPKQASKPKLKPLDFHHLFANQPDAKYYPNITRSFSTEKFGSKSFGVSRSVSNAYIPTTPNSQPAGTRPFTADESFMGSLSAESDTRSLIQNKEAEVNISIYIFFFLSL